MRVFISWSGDRSRAVADLLDEWLQCVLQAVEPWMSSKDIDRGSLWFAEISDQLRDTNIGILCITQDNKDKPWILFEAGALAKGLSGARVCTFLIDLEPTDIGNPLAQFNHTVPDRNGVWELVRTINSALAEASLREKTLERVFDTYWPQFENGFQKAIQDNPASAVAPARSEESILLEVLRTVRSMDRRIRQLEALSSESGTDMEQRIKGDARALVARVQRLVDKGTPAELIEIMLSKEAPRQMVRHLVQSAINAKAAGVDEGDSSG